MPLLYSSIKTNFLEAAEDYYKGENFPFGILIPITDPKKTYMDYYSEITSKDPIINSEAEPVITEEEKASINRGVLYENNGSYIGLIYLIMRDGFSNFKDPANNMFCEFNEMSNTLVPNPIYLQSIIQKVLYETILIDQIGIELYKLIQAAFKPQTIQYMTLFDQYQGTTYLSDNDDDPKIAHEKMIEDDFNSSPQGKMQMEFHTKLVTSQYMKIIQKSFPQLGFFGKVIGNSNPAVNKFDAIPLSGPSIDTIFLSLLLPRPSASGGTNTVVYNLTSNNIYIHRSESLSFNIGSNPYLLELNEINYFDIKYIKNINFIDNSNNKTNKNYESKDMCLISFDYTSVYSDISFRITTDHESIETPIQSYVPAISGKHYYKFNLNHKTSTISNVQVTRYNGINFGEPGFSAPLITGVKLEPIVINGNNIKIHMIDTVDLNNINKIELEWENPFVAILTNFNIDAAYNTYLDLPNHVNEKLKINNIPYQIENFDSIIISFEYESTEILNDTEIKFNLTCEDEGNVVNYNDEMAYNLVKKNNMWFGKIPLRKKNLTIINVIPTTIDDVVFDKYINFKFEKIENVIIDKNNYELDKSNIYVNLFLSNNYNINDVSNIEYESLNEEASGGELFDLLYEGSTESDYQCSGLINAGDPISESINKTARTMASGVKFYAENNFIVFHIGLCTSIFPPIPVFGGCSTTLSIE